MRYSKFTKLMSIIISDDNILLAYRNIKRNNRSATAGVDKVTIRDIEKLSTDEYCKIVKKRFAYYNPRKSEFLGFELKMVRKGYDRKGRKRFVYHSHVTEKAKQRVKKQLKDQIKQMQKAASEDELIKCIQIYNSMVIGIYN